MLIKELEQKGLIFPPSWLSSNCCFLTITGSFAYGVSSDTSDMDIYGFCIPKKDVVFPHLAGEISGFGHQIKRFNEYQQHHVFDKDALAGKGRTYDITVYSIIKYFQLLMDNNPNIIDSLFVPRECILHSTQISELVRENRRIFLHKGAWYKFKGYAFSQMSKIKTKDPTGKRLETIERYGYDTKYGYHLVRLLSECEQILTEGDLDLQRNNEQLKAIRRGEISLDDLTKWFSEKEIQLEKLYNESKLPWGPDENRIKALLLKCLEMHYGSLEDAIHVPGKERTCLEEIKTVLNKYGF